MVDESKGMYFLEYVSIRHVTHYEYYSFTFNTANRRKVNNNNSEYVKLIQIRITDHDNELRIRLTKV